MSDTAKKEEAEAACIAAVDGMLKLMQEARNTPNERDSLSDNDEFMKSMEQMDKEMDQMDKEVKEMSEVLKRHDRMFKRELIREMKTKKGTKKC